MVDKADILLDSNGGSSNIVQLPGRRYPAIAIQGDTWSTYLSNASESLKIAKKLDQEELVDRLEFLVESFETFQDIYEDLLLDNGFDLPYEKHSAD